jgi:predicted metal-dependent peptidase
VTQSISKDHSWARPNRRFLGSGLYLPSLQSDAVDHALVAIDTSGSVSDRQAQEAFSDELQGLLDTGAVDKVTVVYCDAMIHGEPEEYHRGDVIELRRPGGGGTNFAPVTQWAADQQAACLIYLTDLACWSFGEDPGLPVLWAKWGAFKHPNIPFGEEVEIDPHF